VECFALEHACIPLRYNQAYPLEALGLRPNRVVWIVTKTTADTLRAAEHVLRIGNCGALLLRQPHVRPESLRRLHLTAHAGETLCFMFRPIAAAQDASASPLRLSLRPAAGGLDVGFVKRRGPSTDQTLFLPMPLAPVFLPAPQRHVEPTWAAPTGAPVHHGAAEMTQ
jgi:protein ImuA